MPRDAAIGCVKPIELEVGGQQKDRSAVHCGSGARSVVGPDAALGIERIVQRGGPQLGAVGDAQGHAHLLGQPANRSAGLREGAAAADGKTTQAIGEGPHPHRVGR